MRIYRQMILIIIILVGVIPLTIAVQGKKSTIFPEQEGWKRTKNIQIYSRDTLYQYVNGAADLYLSYDFQDLQVAEYKDKKKAQLTIEVYRHRTPSAAFGIYTQERPSECNFLDIGFQSYSEEGVLNFVSGKYYVKIYGYYLGPNILSVMHEFAKKINANLGQKTVLIKVLECFPVQNKIKNSEKYIIKDVIGYSFFHSGYTVDYKEEDSKFRLFILEGKDIKDAQFMVSQYLAKLGQNQKTANEGEFYVLDDQYHGSVAFVWKSNYIWGTIGIREADLQLKYLNLIKDGLLARKLIK